MQPAALVPRQRRADDEVGDLDQLAASYNGRVPFLLVYIREAHAADECLALVHPGISILIARWKQEDVDGTLTEIWQSVAGLFPKSLHPTWDAAKHAYVFANGSLVYKKSLKSAEGDAKVITLCGSTKFEAEFAEVNQRLTMEGCVVISLGMFSLPDLPDYDWTVDSSDLKGRLGGVHFQKIRMADEVYIVDPGGYVGESTRREIAYAESLGKPVRYLSRERLARTGDGPKSESDRA